MTSRPGYLLLLPILAGCVYPIHKTLQPQSQARVLDGHGDPIAAAEVQLISNSYPYGFEKSRHRVKTNAEGIAKFDEVQEWRTEMLMIHGAELFFWNWCVRKEGYRTQFTDHRSSNGFEAQKVFALAEGPSEPCPQREH